MSPDTLPPGWAGNDAEHHATVGVFTLSVGRKRHYNRHYNPFAQRHERIGPYLWSVKTTHYVLHSSATTGEPTADGARKAAILAARVMALEIGQGCDWLATPPSAAGGGA